ncbi:ATP-binding cassette domain-containing protein [Rhodobacteraceae bacterium RKSG542]|uniref:ABC transporter transmembrane domain-containing protein n=1 Tax=Pseudovibrio flavus TaxID=2529854 RepID=UPI0012BB84EE|nr:ABC transporter transmembrane domain-containing protein [Pseudovibrio flavus]MTI16573.1 ATP-binding cassette domain-containing protein [Pseudovibrio flavus]
MSQAEPVKPRISLKPLLALLPFLMHYKGRVYGAIAALVAAAGLTLVLPVALRQMIDLGFDAGSAAAIDQYFLVIILVGGALAVASASRYYLVMWIGERAVAELRSAVFRHLTELSPSFFDKTRSGEIISRLSADTTLIKSAFGASASIAMRQVLLLIGAAGMMVVTSPKLSAIVLLAIPLVVLPLIAFGRSVRQRSRTAQDSLADALAYATEALGAVRTLQAFTAEKQVSDRFENDTQTAFSAAIFATRARSILIATIMLVVTLSIVSVLWIGALSVIDGTMSGGELTQFLIYSIMAAGGVSSLAQVWGELSQAAGAAERLSELLAIEPDIAEPSTPQHFAGAVRGAIAFEGVGFSYPTSTSLSVLENISLHIRNGENVAIVGPSGAGKSTLFQLLMRFYDPSEGRITLDGKDLTSLPLHELRDQIALVPQDTAIFAMSVADNIAYGSPHASREDVERAGKLARADEFIVKMEEGYDTIIGERGFTLSGGQRQRIAIARAILKDAPVLLLDEATSALDAESETLVQTALEELMKGRTTLVIAHRLATVLKADRIIVMENGGIVESGTHASLIQKGGLYAKLARMQFDSGNAAMQNSD